MEQIIEHADTEEVFKVFSQERVGVQQRFVEQTAKRPTSAVWRGSGGAVLRRDVALVFMLCVSHGSFWTNFLRFYVKGDTDSEVHFLTGVVMAVVTTIVGFLPIFRTPSAWTSVLIFQPSSTHSCECSRAQGGKGPGRREVYFQVTRHTLTQTIRRLFWTYTVTSVKQRQ